MGAVLSSDPAAADEALTVKSLFVEPGYVDGVRWRRVMLGSQIDLVLTNAPAAQVRVWLDGLPVSLHPEVRQHGARPGISPIVARPLLAQVQAANPLASEHWTVALTEVAPDRHWFAFRVEGTVTGLDGTGRSDRPFRSRSGRVVIQPADWAEWAEIGEVVPGYTFGWDVVERFQELVTNAPAGTVVTVAGGLKNALHTLELEPLTGTLLPISEVRVKGIPPTESIQFPDPYIRSISELNFLARFTAYRGTGPAEEVLYDVPAGIPGLWNESLRRGSDNLERGKEIFIPRQEAVKSGIEIPYYADFDLVGGWVFRIYAMDGPPWGSERLDYELRGDIKSGGGVIGIHFPYDAGNVFYEHFVFSVRFQRGPGGSSVGLIVPDRTVQVGISRPGVWQWLREGEGNVERFSYDENPFSSDPWPVPPPRALRLDWSDPLQVLRLSAYPLTRYRLESSPTLTPANWQPQADLVVDADGELEWPLPNSGDSSGFLRVIRTQ